MGISQALQPDCGEVALLGGEVRGTLMGRRGDSSHVVLWGQPMELLSW